MQWPVWLKPESDGLLVYVWIRSGAKSTQLLGEHDGRLKVMVGAPAIDNRANQCLIRFIAELAGVAPSHARLVSGPKSKQKTVALRTPNPETAAVALYRALDQSTNNS